MEEQLEVFDQALANLSAQIYDKRRAYLKKLSPYFQQYYDGISHGKEKVFLYYESQDSIEEGTIADITEQIEKLKEYRQSVISEVVTGKVAVE